MNASKRVRAGACGYCRVRKRRCIPTTTGAACQLCSLISKPCSLEVFPRSVTRPFKNGLNDTLTDTPSPADSLVTGSGAASVQEYQSPNHSSADPARSLVVDLVGLYFRFIHNVSHSMFHESSFMSKLHEDRAPKLVVLSMIALAARFSQDRFFNGSDPRSRGRPYASEAIQLLHLSMTSPSLETVQASMLLGNFIGGEGDNRGKHIYVGIARIHAEAIRMPEFPTGSTAAIREEYRRSWLTVRIADRWSAADMGIPNSLSDRTPLILPAIDDVNFHLTPEEHLMDTEALSLEHSMWVQMAGTFTIFTSINDLLRNLSHNSISFQEYRDKVPNLSQQLNNWIERLPARLVYSMANLTFFNERGLGRTFLAMHIGIHHFQQILFYPFLDPRFREHIDKSSQTEGYPFSDSARLCKQNAKMVSEIAKIGFDTQGCELRYFLHGHIVVISSCIHLHTLLFNEDPEEVSKARELLISNFQLLMRMKLHWPVVDFSVARLRSFQNDCRLSRSRPFVLDNWMLKFLMEHTTVLSERQPGGSAPYSRQLSPGPGQTVDNGEKPAQPPPQSASETQDDASPPWHKLNNLLHETDTTNESLVDNALGWLLDH